MSPHRAKDISLFARFLRGYLRTDLRGQTRLTLLFARHFRSLQFVPITVGDCKPFYIDLSKGRHELLVGAPWEETPWEQPEQHVMKNTVLPGDIVFDVGANIGLHTVLLSKLAGKNGKLCVFEPNTELLPQLKVTLEGLGNAVLFPFALSNKSEVATLFVPENAEMGSLADWTAGRDDVGTTHTIDCEVRRLDDLVEAGIVPLPDYIKCDAEGAELLIFQGGEKTLNRAEAPIILFEANVHNARGFGLALDDAKNYLANLELPQYRFFEIQETKSLIPIIAPHPIHSNILSVPLTKLDRIANLTTSKLSK